jgi:hypothetical protein
MTTQSVSHVDPIHWQSDGRNVPEIQDGNKYLIDGEIREWSGQSQRSSSSPAYFSIGMAVSSAPHLGHAPVLDASEALEAPPPQPKEHVGTTVTGEWPTMTVAARINAVPELRLPE